ncbi:MAG: AbiEi antitoxin N-terminal domain-containing protein [Myxococcales bacterium]|nr:MAG: AbiEi antitoxin N-terminal domain-containing protein [Myxococcales bacterium]
MSSGHNTKINQVLKEWRPGMVATQRWLDSRGVYYQLADRYVRGGWFQKLAVGVYCRAGDRPSWAGAVHALQVHDEHCVYPGGKAALVMLGHGHFVQRGESKLTLFGPPASRLPKWFAEHDWGLKVEYRTNVLFDDAALGLSKRDIDGFQMQLSGAERAMLEMLLDVPGEISVGDASAIARGAYHPAPLCTATAFGVLFGPLSKAPRALARRSFRTPLDGQAFP